MPSIARKLAVEVLLRVEQGSAFANLALDGALRAAGVLEPREAALKIGRASCRERVLASV